MKGHSMIYLPIDFIFSPKFLPSIILRKTGKRYLVGPGVKNMLLTALTASSGCAARGKLSPSEMLT